MHDIETDTFVAFYICENISSMKISQKEQKMAYSTAEYNLYLHLSKSIIT